VFKIEKAVVVCADDLREPVDSVHESVAQIFKIWASFSGRACSLFVGQHQNPVIEKAQLSCACPDWLPVSRKEPARCGAGGVCWAMTEFWVSLSWLGVGGSWNCCDTCMPDPGPREEDPFGRLGTLLPVMFGIPNIDPSRIMLELQGVPGMLPSAETSPRMELMSELSLGRRVITGNPT
jgi:hypothetical protein